MGIIKDFAGKEYKTSKGGVLTIVEMLPIAKGKPRKYRCTCSICSLDTELFPNGFLSSKGHLDNSKVPCACTAFKYSERQQYIRVKRKCKELDYDFSGWVETFNGINTKIRLYNKITDNFWSSCSIDNFMHGKKDPAMRTLLSNLACKKEWVGATKIT